MVCRGGNAGAIPWVNEAKSAVRSVSVILAGSMSFMGNKEGADEVFPKVNVMQFDLRPGVGRPGERGDV